MGKTGVTGLLCAALKSDELQFVKTFTADIFAILCSVHFKLFLLNCVTGTIQVAEGHKYLSLGPHAPSRQHDGQTCSRQMLEDYIKLGHILFRSHTCQFIFYSLSYNSMLSSHIC